MPQLFSVCPDCEWKPIPFDGTARLFGDFDKCLRCHAVTDIWTESAVQNEEMCRKLSEKKP